MGQERTHLARDLHSSANERQLAGARLTCANSFAVIHPKKGSEKAVIALIDQLVSAEPLLEPIVILTRRERELEEVLTKRSRQYATVMAGRG